MNEIEQSIYQFICDYIRDMSYAPTQREIAEGYFVGRETVFRYLGLLIAHGKIVCDPEIARGITLTKD